MQTVAKSATHFMRNILMLIDVLSPSSLNNESNGSDGNTDDFLKACDVPDLINAVMRSEISLSPGVLTRYARYKLLMAACAIFRRDLGLSDLSPSSHKKSAITQESLGGNSASFKTQKSRNCDSTLLYTDNVEGAKAKRI